MQRAYLELLGPSMISVMLVVIVVNVVVIAVLGPMGTFEALTLLQRLAFGTLYVGLGWPLCYSTTVVTFYFMRFRSPLEMAFAVTLAKMFSAVPGTAVVHTGGTLAHPDYSAAFGLAHLYTLVATTTVANGLLLVYLVYQRVKHAGLEVASAATSDSGQFADAGTREGTAGTPDETKSIAAAERKGGDAALRERFLAQLPAEVGHDVIYLKGEDHYVQVRTSIGSGLIKMRFADAVAALGDAGIQAHRSYWVALVHVKELTRRDGRRLVLRLTDGYEVPVSARYRPDVRAAVKRASLPVV